MIKKIAVACVVLASFGTLGAQHEVEFYLESHSVTDIAPVMQLAKDDWKYAPESDAQAGFSQSRFGIAYKHHSQPNWRMHIMQRVDYQLTTNPQTALGYYQEQNDMPLNSFDKYQVDIDLTGARSRGLGLEYTGKIDSLWFSFQANYWQLNYLRDAVITGEVSGKDDLQLLGNLQYEEFYTHNNFLKRPNKEGEWQTSGSGYSIDFAFKWALSPSLQVHGEVKDLVNSFEIDNTGYTEADINTKGSFVDNEGFSSFRPLLKGYELEKNFDFELPVQAKVGLDYKTGPFVYHLNSIKQGDQQFTQIGVTEGAWSLLFKPSNKTVDIHYRGEKINWQLGLNDINPSKALAIHLGVSGKVTW